MQQDVIVSVIVSVYNTEKHLRQFMDSVVAQTLREIEIICVDDGSTDGSPALLREYAARDSRVTVISQENRGVGNARNTGLDAARGKYVFFADPDDWCELTLLEKCRDSMASTGSDFVAFGREVFDDATNKTVRTICIPAALLKMRSFSPENICDSLFQSFGSAIWNKLYSRDFIQRNGLRFQELPCNTDSYFINASYMLAERISVLPDMLYHHRQNREGSLRRDRHDAPFTWFHVFNALDRVFTSRGEAVGCTYSYYLFRVEQHLTRLKSLRSLPDAAEYTRRLREDPLFQAGAYCERILPLLPDRSEQLAYFALCGRNFGLAVSLTSFPARIGLVYQAIESLFAQSVKPDRIILWLAESQFPGKEKALPQSLLEYVPLGLEIGWCGDTRSYKKLLPTLERCPDMAIVTVDDDALYSADFLAKLVKGSVDHPGEIICHRVTGIVIDTDGAFHALGGGLFAHAGARFLNKPVGNGGVLYPPHCLYRDVLNDSLVLELAPTNDDQWFWAQAVLAGTGIRAVEEAEYQPATVAGSQETALTKMNDSGERLFWKDFARLCGYYPAFEDALRREWAENPSLHFDNMQVYRNRLENWYYRTTRTLLDLDHPKTYNEKIQWMKLFDSTPLKTKLADKYLVRKWVEDKIGGEYLIPLLGVYDRFDEIDFSTLPDRFVVKANHGCTYNYIVKDKRTVNFDDMREKVNGWLNDNYGERPDTELHYRDIKPKILIEQYIENTQSHGDLYDYKFMCFNGQVEYIMFLSERNIDGLKIAFYDREWRKYTFAEGCLMDHKINKKPANLELMTALAEKLSAGFSHVRVDFYHLDSGKVYFGEMTFTSESGLGVWEAPEVNERLGRLITLPKLGYNVDTKEYFPPELTRSRMARSEETVKLPAKLTQLQAEEKKLKARNQQLEKQLRQLQEKEKKTAEFARALEKSTSYRLGRALTKWPHRLLNLVRKGK